MLSAFEVQIRKGCKDEAEWRRRHGEIYAEPAEVRKQRLSEQRKGLNKPQPQKMSVDDAQALLARFAASDASYG